VTEPGVTRSRPWTEWSVAALCGWLNSPGGGHLLTEALGRSAVLLVSWSAMFLIGPHRERITSRTGARHTCDILGAFVGDMARRVLYCACGAGRQFGRGDAAKCGLSGLWQDVSGEVAACELSPQMRDHNRAGGEEAGPATSSHFSAAGVFRRYSPRMWCSTREIRQIETIAANGLIFVYSLSTLFVGEFILAMG